MCSLSVPPSHSTEDSACCGVRECEDLPRDVTSPSTDDRTVLYVVRACARSLFSRTIGDVNPRDPGLRMGGASGRACSIPAFCPSVQHVSLLSGSLFLAPCWLSRFAVETLPRGDILQTIESRRAGPSYCSRIIRAAAAVAVTVPEASLATRNAPLGHPRPRPSRPRPLPRQRGPSPAVPIVLSHPIHFPSRRPPCRVLPSPFTPGRRRTRADRPRRVTLPIGGPPHRTSSVPEVAGRRARARDTGRVERCRGGRLTRSGRASGAAPFQAAAHAKTAWRGRAPPLPAFKSAPAPRPLF